jgi:hypothetical protein
MNALSDFFDKINNSLGVNNPTDLIINPWFMGLCIAAFLFTLFLRMKYLALGIAGFLGFGVIIHYYYPIEVSDLGDLLKFVGIMGGYALVLLYFGFIRE